MTGVSLVSLTAQYLACLKTSRSQTDKLSFDVGLQEDSTGNGPPPPLCHLHHPPLFLSILAVAPFCRPRFSPFISSLHCAAFDIFSSLSVQHIC